MQRYFILIFNCALLALLFVAIPAATRTQFVGLQIARGPTTQMLMLWGAGVAAGINILGAVFLIKGRKEKIIGWEWAAVFGGLWFVLYAMHRGWLDFEWLKRALLWVQAHF